MPKVTNDDLEHKLNSIKAALGIQTTTSSVLDDIKRELDEVKDDLAKAVAKEDRNFRAVCAFVVLSAGLALAIGAAYFVPLVLAHAYYIGLMAVAVIMVLVGLFLMLRVLRALP